MAFTVFINSFIPDNSFELNEHNTGLEAGLLPLNEGLEKYPMAVFFSLTHTPILNWKCKC